MSIFAQGSLTPPGAPAATMKSLDQIEARTPISSAPFAINASGSYYLTKNLTVSSGSAVFINVSDVTLDLNGFTISSTRNPASSDVAVSGSGALRNVNILNGAISSGVTVSGGTYSGTGFGYGIYIPSAVTASVCRVSVAGVLNHGIYLGFSSSVVEACTVDTAGGYGIAASAVSHSTALNTGSAGVFGNNVSDCCCTSSLYGIYALTVSNSYGASTGSNTPGIYATTVTNSSGSGTSDSGIQATNVDNSFGTTSGASSSGILGDTVNNSRGTSLGAGYGLRANATASNSYGFNSSTTGIGLRAFSASNCYGYAAGSGQGIFATTATGCSGHSASGNAVDALLATGCYGTSTSGNGLNATTVNGCIGYGGTNGIYATVVTGSYGYTSSSTSPNSGINGNPGVGVGLVAFSFGDRAANPAIGILSTTIFNCNGGSFSGHKYFGGSGADPYP